MKVHILTLDTPNLNHNIYPKEVVEKSIAKYKKEHIDEKRALVVKKIPESETINLEDVIGIVTNINIENDKVFVDVNFLPEIKDAIISETGISDGKLSLRTSGVGTITKQPDGNYKINDDYEIISCFITDKPA